jgi:hypothetical protein
MTDILFDVVETVMGDRGNGPEPVEITWSRNVDALSASIRVAHVLDLARCADEPAPFQPKHISVMVRRVSE